MNAKELTVGGHVSFVDRKVTHTGVIASVDGHGDAEIGTINPPITTVVKSAADLTPCK